MPVKQFRPMTAGTRFRAVTVNTEITRKGPEKSLVDLATTCHGADGRTIATGRALLIYAGDVA